MSPALRRKHRQGKAAKLRASLAFRRDCARRHVRATIAELRRWRAALAAPPVGRLGEWMQLTARRHCIAYEAQLRRRLATYRRAMARWRRVCRAAERAPAALAA